MISRWFFCSFFLSISSLMLLVGELCDYYFFFGFSVGVPEGRKKVSENITKL